jgi:tetrahydromethanopterin S-methyltransferase subunit G
MEEDKFTIIEQRLEELEISHNALWAAHNQRVKIGKKRERTVFLLSAIAILSLAGMAVNFERDLEMGIGTFKIHSSAIPSYVWQTTFALSILGMNSTQSERFLKLLTAHLLGKRED